MNICNLNTEIYESIIENEDLYIEDILNLKLVSKEFYDLINQKKYYLRIIHSLQGALKEVKHSKNVYKSKVIRTQLIMYEESYSEDDSDVSEILPYESTDEDYYI